MKKTTKLVIILLVIAMMMVAFSTTAFADEFIPEKGFNDDGYNYNAHIYVGDYGYGDGTLLVMKWNEAWLSKKDSDADGKLDRHLGLPSYIDSGAWCTNHWVGTYVEEGVTYKYTEFIKIVAVTSNDELVGGYWYDEDGNEIGETIWGSFAIVMDVYNDKGTGDHGVLYKGRPALGNLQ